jgi:hypothetical protein
MQHQEIVNPVFSSLTDKPIVDNSFNKLSYIEVFDSQRSDRFPTQNNLKFHPTTGGAGVSLPSSSFFQVSFTISNGSEPVVILSPSVMSLFNDIKVYINNVAIEHDRNPGIHSLVKSILSPASEEKICFNMGLPHQQDLR